MQIISISLYITSFVAVGLDSSLRPEDVQRPPLNIVLLVDYSGSMGSPFDRYYYDQFGREQELSAEESTVPKMDVAKDVMNGIIDKLGPNDRLSVVLFSTDACVPLPLTEVRCLDVENLKQDIERDVAATDSTNMAAGFDLAMSQLTGCAECMEAGLAGAENRIMLITDAMPNEGQWSEEALVERLKSSAEQDIHTTVIGGNISDHLLLKRTGGAELQTISRVANGFVLYSFPYAQVLAWISIQSLSRL
jgi:Ca-activated chloride channel homolog